ncbi:purine and uridine phosphorylase [Aspergillus sclerotioniger CBS 115572]|uniref:Purine and uridine phosphorylase n=1 Tax=Aspergillus sclerotioniger CBS 115572 TaxID=1450535 RepID=A0A317WR17_9EURO|nr:purine and uridine phosphorylase [Aspergillus sclerotioniger CBS 115572]PWY88889.1 purine and uridine phosphorylase [Aspergillus sclerotioniger CBS 115572]
MSGKDMLSHDDFAVGWICTLPLEMTAAKAVLDHEYPRLPQPEHDHNTYVLGRVSGHNLVITCLPSGIYGTTAATAVVNQMLSTFRSLRFGLMVGIGEGVPSPTADVRLGDVVVSKPTAGLPGVIQYDYGKTVASGRFQQTGALNKPPLVLLSVLSSLEADRLAGGCGNDSHDKIMTDARIAVKDLTVFRYPGAEHDWLFHASYDHDPCFEFCAECDPDRQVRRQPRASPTPVVHYGNIASGNQIMKHGLTRDRIAQTAHGILCFEMEAAGIMDLLPCLVIRGICDYSDSHKNKEWQGFAALTAAAYAKELLAKIPVLRVEASTVIKAPGPGTSNLFEVRFDTIDIPRSVICVGREAELAMVSQSLRSGKSRGIVSLSGMGGIGKTQVSIEYTMRHW